MTSRKSFCNFKMAGETVKQSKYIMILHTVLLFLITTLPAIINVNNYEKAPQNYNPDCIYKFTSYLAGNSIFTGLSALGVATITAIFVYSYLFSKNSVQFYNSMPYTRENMFISKFIACAISLFVPILIIFAVNSVVYVSLELNTSYILLVTGFLTVLLQYIAALAVAGFAASVSGNFFALMAIEAAVYLIYPATTGIIYVSCESWFKTIGIVFNYNGYYMMPPFLTMNGFYNSPTAGAYVYAVIYSMIFIMAGIFFYKKRKSENTEKFFAFKGLGTFLKYYVSFLASLLFGALFYELSEKSIVIAYIGYILIAFVVYITLQAIIEKNFKSMFLNMKSFVIFALIIGALVSIPLCFGEKIDNILPDGSKISKLGANIEHNGYYNNYEFKDREIIKSAVNLYNSALPSADSMEYSSHISIASYKTNPFFYIRRSDRFFSNESYDSFLCEVYDREEYKNHLIGRIQEEHQYSFYDISKFGNVGVSSHQNQTAKEISNFEKFETLKEIFKSEYIKYSYADIKNKGVYANLKINGITCKIYNNYAESIDFIKKNFDIGLVPDNIAELTVVYVPEENNNKYYDTPGIAQLETEEPGQKKGEVIYKTQNPYDIGYISENISEHNGYSPYRIDVTTKSGYSQSYSITPYNISHEVLQFIGIE